MDPRGTVGSIYKGENYTLVHTTYESSGPYGFGEDFFKFFPWAPGARLAGFIKRANINCYKQNMKALGLLVSEKKIFLCFAHDPPPRAGPFLTPGARFAGFIKRTTIHIYTQNMKGLGLVVLEKKIF